MENEYTIAQDSVKKSIYNLIESLDAKDREILRLSEENKKLKGILGVVDEESENVDMN